VHGKCRFLDAHGKLGRARSCGKPLFVHVAGPASWKSRTRGLARGSYSVRFRTADTRGNARKHPRARVVSVH
jgi:hypothetical protein